MRRFAAVTAGFLAAAAFLMGLIVAGSLTPSPAGGRASWLGLAVGPLDRMWRERLNLTREVEGIVVQRISSPEAYARRLAAARPGDVLAFYVYLPASAQRSLRTVRVESR